MSMSRRQARTLLRIDAARGLSKAAFVADDKWNALDVMVDEGKDEEAMQWLLHGNKHPDPDMQRRQARLRLVAEARVRLR